MMEDSNINPCFVLLGLIFHSGFSFNGARARALNAFVVVVDVDVVAAAAAVVVVRKFVKCNAHKSKLALGRKEENAVAIF